MGADVVGTQVSNPGGLPMWGRVNGGRRAHHVVSYAATPQGGGSWSQVKTGCGLWGQTYTRLISSEPTEPKCRTCQRLIP